MFPQVSRCRINYCAGLWLLVALLLGLLSGSRAAHAQPASAIVGVRGDIRKIKPGQAVSFYVNVFPGNPRQLFGDPKSWKYEWEISGATADSSQEANPSFTIDTTGHYTVRVYIHDQYGTTVHASQSFAVPNPKTGPGKPPAPPGPTVPSTYHPLQGAKIFGPLEIKAGERTTWEGVPDGGADHQYKWVIEENGAHKEVRGVRQPGKNIRLGGSIKKPGTARITFYIWDKKTPESKAASDTIQVKVVEASPTSTKIASPSRGPLTGWWLWLRERTDDKGKKVVDKVPVYINTQSSDGSYIGRIFHYLTMSTLHRHTEGEPAPGRFEGKMQGGNFVFTWSYDSGNHGPGSMNVSGNSMVGAWRDVTNGTSGKWKMERAGGADVATLKSLFGGRG